MESKQQRENPEDICSLSLMPVNHREEEFNLFCFTYLNLLKKLGTFVRDSTNVVAPVGRCIFSFFKKY